MPVTGLRGRQILDGDVLRDDLNITTSGSAVIRRIIAGTNITISSTGVDTGTGDVTINASGGTGTVTSVGLSLPNIFSVTGSPVTTSGTLTATFASQTANTVFAAPNGSAGTPTFRALVAADIPDLTLEKLPDAWVKRAVKVATTANITLSGTQTIDGIAVVAGDRVLVKNQSTSSQNGIYIVAAGAWTRSTDADVSSELAGAMVAVDQGTANGGTTWDTDFKSTDTIGTTANTWFRIIDTGYGAALTKTDDTNVTLTLGGSASTALINAASLTLGWTGQLAVGRGGTGASTLTGVVIGNGTSAMTAVAGTASQLLRRNAGNTAYEFFSAGNLTKTDDTNVTLTLGGTPTGALINAVSLTLGWSGQLAVGRGGTGASTLTGVVIGNGTSAMTAVAGTASQLLRRNAGNTAYEFFTHDFASTSGATFTGQIAITRTNNTADGQGQIFLNGTVGNRIDWSTAGIAAPSFTTRSVGTKLVLYPAVSGTLTDYAFGIDSDTLWASVASSGGSFKWYGATTLNMHLSGANLVIGTGAGVGSGRLTVNAATGGTSLYLTDAVNSTLIISHPALGVTRFTNGASVLWMQESGGLVSIGKSTSAVAQLFVHNENLALPALFSQNQSTATTLQDSIPLKFTDLYNSGANGHNLFFNSSASSGVWEYNITKTYGGILTFGVSNAGVTLTRHMYLYDGGQLRLANYTTTSSFTGTAVGVLAFTSNGSIITIPTPGGGSGLTGSGTTNYVPKFTGSTSVGNSLLFDNGSDVGINTATPTNTANYTSLQINGTSGGLLRFSYAGTNAGHIYGSSAEIGVNATSVFNLYIASSQKFNVIASEVNAYETFYARKLGAQIQLAGGVATASGIFQAGNNNLFIADWNTGANGIVIDVSNGILRTRSSQANGAYIEFQRSTSTIYGYIGNSAQLFGAGFNGNTELGLRSEGAINFATSGGVAIARMQTTGQLRLPLYTAWNTFNTTDAQGGLYFDTSGNIMTGVPPIYRIQFTAAGNFTLSSMASALQFFNNQTAYIVRADLTGYRRVRLHVLKGGTAGAATAVIRLRYSTTFTTTAASYSEIGTTAVSVSISGTNTYLTTSWIDLATLARGDVYVALMQEGGNGSTSPIVGNIAAEFDF